MKMIWVFVALLLLISPVFIFPISSKEQKKELVICVLVTIAIALLLYIGHNI